MRRVGLRFREIDSKKFHFINVGYETHGRPSFRLWVAGRLVVCDEDGYPYIEFPVCGARIERTAKGNLVLRPAKDWIVYDIFKPAGYRGESRVQVLEPSDADVLEYQEYESPRGALGISRGALVSVKEAPLRWSWSRTGRLYGASPEGLVVTYPDGREEELELLPASLEALNELKGLLQ